MIKRRLLTVLLSLLTTSLALGDKVILNDGTEIEGKVLSEEGDSYEIEVQVTGTIKDRKLIKKSDVKSIVRTSPEDIHFKAIEGLVPTPDRLGASDYDNMINRQVKAFTDAYPKTKHRKRIESLLAILTRERDRAKAGGIKLDGQWISPDDRAANAFEIDARMLYEDMVEAADAKKHTQALRAFEEFEAEYSGSSQLEKAVAKAQEVMKAYGPIVAQGIRRVDPLIEKRTSEWQRLTASQRAAALADTKRRDEIYQKVLKKEKDSRTRWLSIQSYHKAPMEEVLRHIQGELRRLDALSVDESKQAGAVYRDAWAAAVAGDEQAANQHFGSLASLRVTDKYIDQLKARLAETLEAKAAPPSGTGNPDTPDGSGDTTEGTDNGDSTDDGEANDTENADDGEARTPVRPVQPDLDERSSGMSMTTILMIVMVVVLVIAAIAVFTGGKKKK